MNMRIDIDVAERQARNASKHLEMEDPVRQVEYLLSALDRVVWHHREEEALPLPVFREIDAVLAAARAEHGKCFAQYEVTAT